MNANPLSGQSEKLLPPGAMLVCKTDLEGRFLEINGALSGISGYTTEEIVGAGQSLIHHPDVPRQILADMDKALSANRPWQGILKHRSKDDQYFWTETLAVPIREGDATVGRLAVCSEPTREAISAAEALYEELRASQKPLRPPVSLTEFLSVRSGVILGIIFVALLMIIGGVLGIGGLNRSNESLEALYRNHLQPSITMGRISFLMADNRSQVSLGVHDLAASKVPGTPPPLAEISAAIERNKLEINELWNGLMRLPKYQHEAELMQGYWQARQNYVQDGLNKAVAALQEGDQAKAEELLRRSVNPLYEEANRHANTLLAHVKKNAEDELRLVISNNEMRRDLALFGIVGGLLIVAVSGGLFLVGIVRPLDESIQHMESIASGNLNTRIEINGGGETGRLTRAIAVMQLRLRVVLDDIRNASSNINSECATLNQLTMAVAERNEEQHDRIYQVIDAAGKTQASQTEAYEKTLATLEIAERLLAETQDEDQSRLLDGVREIAVAAQLQTFMNDDTAARMHQVAELVVDNREAAQQAWAASANLRGTAEELDGTVRYFS